MLPELQVLALSMHDSEQMTREVIAAGASGYVLKTEAGTQLLKAIDAIRERRSFFHERFAATAQRHAPAPSAEAEAARAGADAS
jgi:DNA-binding NarL/FixJ family response regulator